MSTASTKKWVYKRYGIRLNRIETEKLEKYCEKYGRNFNDVVRELVRNLPD